jgi:hypothetical protein
MVALSFSMLEQAARTRAVHKINGFSKNFMTVHARDRSGEKQPTFKGLIPQSI